MISSSEERLTIIRMTIIQIVVKTRTERSLGLGGVQRNTIAAKVWMAIALKFSRQSWASWLSPDQDQLTSVLQIKDQITVLFAMIGWLTKEQQIRRPFAWWYLNMQCQDRLFGNAESSPIPCATQKAPSSTLCGEMNHLIRSGYSEEDARIGAHGFFNPFQIHDGT